MEEMRQSMRIIEQAMAQMEDGPITANVRRIARPPIGEVYVRTESPRGDFAVFLVSDGTDKPYRVKVRAPSFANLQAFKHMLRDAYLADAVVILGLNRHHPRRSGQVARVRLPAIRAGCQRLLGTYRQTIYIDVTVMRYK